MNELANGIVVEDLLNRETIFEFYLRESEQKDNAKIANNVRLVYAPGRERRTDISLS